MLYTRGWCHRLTVVNLWPASSSRAPEIPVESPDQPAFLQVRFVRPALIESMAHPGGNVPGLAQFEYSLAGK